MRRLLLSCVVATVLGVASSLSGTVAYGAPPLGTVPTATAPSKSDDGVQFVQLLAKEDFAGVVAGFDATMKAVLPEEKLRETWQTLNKQVGAFQKVVRTRVVAVPPNRAVIVTCQFEKASLDARVVFEPQGKVTGLFFSVTPPDAAVFKTPGYAKAEAYREKEFTVATPGWPLPGTLTMPVNGKNVPAVVLVHGSGPNDRDETIGTNKPFRDLAWGLATRGIAVVRYEKRTREHGAKLTGDVFAHFTVQQETIEDALTAVAQLRTTEGIDPGRTFVVGHSLGATFAPRIAQGDPKLGGIVLLAGTTRPIEDLMVEQGRYLLSLSGPMDKEKQAQLDALLGEVAKVKGLTAADAGSGTPILAATPGYWLDLREHDPVAAAKSLSMPMLILQGGRDYQVTEADFEGWKKGLAGKGNVTFKLYPELNHLFMTGKGKGTPAEYEVPANVEAGVVNDVAEWVLKGAAGK